MVWAAMGHNFKSELHFVPQGLKIKAQDYLRFMQVFEVEIKQKIGYDERTGRWRQPWTFQQDSAPAHKANITQRWLLDHFPDVITRQQWPASSPDLNPIENIWGILRVNVVAHPNVDFLKQALRREWDKLTLVEINRCVARWPRCLDAMLNAGGIRFEGELH
jgi:inhibitor of nuclear factor kappa-B kinase subunit alpha